MPRPWCRFRTRSPKGVRGKQKEGERKSRRGLPVKRRGERLGRGERKKGEEGKKGEEEKLVGYSATTSRVPLEPKGELPLRRMKKEKKGGKGDRLKSISMWSFNIACQECSQDAEGKRMEKKKKRRRGEGGGVHSSWMAQHALFFHQRLASNPKGFCRRRKGREGRGEGRRKRGGSKEAEKMAKRGHWIPFEKQDLLGKTW